VGLVEGFPDRRAQAKRDCIGLPACLCARKLMDAGIGQEKAKAKSLHLI
jgi:hypothetical protein